MMKRVGIAGALGGLALFVWTFVAHEFLSLGEMGVREIPNEGPVLIAFEAALAAPGFYIFPGVGLGPNATREQRNAAMPAYLKKYERSPHGVLVYHPPSGPFGFGQALGRQLGLNVLEGLLAAWLLSRAAAGRGYLERVAFVAVTGMLASLATNVEYWNWYDFPGRYEAGYMATQIVGYILVGLVAAAFVTVGASICWTF